MSMLPEGWIESTIPELIESDGLFVDGDWVESKDQDPDGDVRLIQLADVGDGRFTSKSARYLTSAKAAQLRCTFLQPGDVLVARMPDPLGRACIFPGDPKRSVTVVDVCVVRTGTNGADHRWLMWAINSPQFRARVDALQSGSTRKRISRGNLATIQLPVPPLAEQRRIVAALEEHLSDLDAAVAGLERARLNHRRYRSAILRSAVDGSLLGDIDRQQRGPDPWSPNVPGHWRFDTVENLAELVEYGTSAKTMEAPDGVPVLRMGNIVDGELSWDSLKYLPSSHDEFPRLLLSPGDVLFNRTNSPELVGKSAVYEATRPQASFASYLLRVRLQPGLNPRFFSAYVNSVYGRAWVASVVSQQVGQANVNGTKLRALSVPLPPEDEQERIVAEMQARLDAARRVMADVDVQLARAARLRQSILRRAFEGRLVPQDPRDEPARVHLARAGAGRDAAPARRRRPTARAR